MGDEEVKYIYRENEKRAEDVDRERCACKRVIGDCENYEPVLFRARLQCGSYTYYNFVELFVIINVKQQLAEIEKKR